MQEQKRIEEEEKKKKAEEERKKKLLNLVKPTVRILLPEPEPVERDDLVNPRWIEDKDLGTGPVKFMKKKEVDFWYEMIDKYLKPLEKNAEKEKQIADGLKELKNQVGFSFLMINAIWLVTVMLLQANKDTLYVEWPWGPQGPTISFVGEEMEVHLEFVYLHLDPIGFFFMIFFAAVLVFQLTGMLLHRAMTLAHIVSTTPLRLTWKQLRADREKPKDVDPFELIQNKGIDIVRMMQRSKVRFTYIL